jgi:hypothetical protein
VRNSEKAKDIRRDATDSQRRPPEIRPRQPTSHMSMRRLPQCTNSVKTRSPPPPCESSLVCYYLPRFSNSGVCLGRCRKAAMNRQRADRARPTPRPEISLTDDRVQVSCGEAAAERPEPPSATPRSAEPIPWTTSGHSHRRPIFSERRILYIWTAEYQQLVFEERAKSNPDRALNRISLYEIRSAAF